MKDNRRSLIKGIAGVGIGSISLSTAASAEQDTEVQEDSQGRELTKNQIKFAKRELPNYLEDTILDGSKRVTVNKTGEEPSFLDSDDYDIIISKNEFDKIESKAISQYIDKYGVDPRNPKATIVDGEVLHIESVRDQIKSGERKPSGDAFITDSATAQSTDPEAISGEIDLHIIPASDSEHSPSESYLNDTLNAAGIFSNKFDIEVNVSTHYGQWDASDHDTDSGNLKADLKDDASSYQSEKNDIITGWVDMMDNNGIADLNGPFSVNACMTTGQSFTDWSHDIIAQHEISHNFDAPDRGTAGFQHEKCIMNYEYAFRQVDTWCDEDRGIINDNIN